MRNLLKKPWLALLALIGIHEHLSAQQKEDIGQAAWQVTPGASGTGVMQVTGFELADLVAALTAIFVAMQIAYLVWKWRRQARIDAERRADRVALDHGTDMGELQ